MAQSIHGSASDPCRCDCAPEDGCFSTRPTAGHYETCPEAVRQVQRRVKMVPCASCGTPTQTLGDVGHCSRCDMCRCGLSRSEHGGLDGHGRATAGGCDQFTWAGWRESPAPEPLMPPHPFYPAGAPDGLCNDCGKVESAQIHQPHGDPEPAPVTYCRVTVCDCASFTLAHVATAGANRRDRAAFCACGHTAWEHTADADDPDQTGTDAEYTAYQRGDFDPEPVFDGEAAHQVLDALLALARDLEAYAEDDPDDHGKQCLDSPDDCARAYHATLVDFGNRAAAALNQGVTEPAPMGCGECANGWLFVSPIIRRPSTSPCPICQPAPTVSENRADLVPPPVSAYAPQMLAALQAIARGLTNGQKARGETPQSIARDIINEIEVRP